MPTKKTNAPAPAADDKRTVYLPPGPGKSEDRRKAELAGEGVASSAHLVTLYGKGTFGELSLNDSVAVLRTTCKEVTAGDMAKAETILMAQAAALDAIFAEMARRAVGQEYLKQYEAFMRMAMKAQNQCRMTLETLATIKNPPVVFARQANINNGGQQQVNNGATAAPAGPASAPAGGGGVESLPAPTLEAASIPTQRKNLAFNAEFKSAEAVPQGEK